MVVFVCILADLCQSNIALREKYFFEKYCEKIKNCRGVSGKLLKNFIIFSGQYCFERVLFFYKFYKKFEHVTVENFQTYYILKNNFCSTEYLALFHKFSFHLRIRKHE